MGTNASHEPLRGGDVSSGRKFPNGTATGIRPYVKSSIRKSLRRRRGKHKAKNNQESENDPQNIGPSEPPHSRTMEKLKRTLSLKKKKDPHIPESSKPHIWQTDESSVRQGTCCFCIKYLGCVEVFESRGMQVCEEALRVLRQNCRRRPVRGVLYVSGDGLRVVDDDTKDLLVDQTIEKVSFCAPDRHHERGFSYICRDGTTRRWMCHGFIASKESGERLSHAVGCAFAVCLEKKQRRDQDSGVTMSFDQSTSTFTRMGSFKQMSMTERLSDPQDSKPLENPLPVKKIENPHAIARPHATPQLLQRQGSFRVFSHLNQSSPFKRQLSLRLCDLPSNLERTRSMAMDNCASVETASDNLLNNNTNSAVVEPFENENLALRIDYDRPSNVNSMPPIPEISALVEPNPQDAVSAMCQQVSAGLSLLSSFQETLSANSDARRDDQINITETPAKELLESGINWSVSNQPENLDGYLDEENSANLSKGEEWLAQLHSGPSIPEPRSIGVQPPQRRNPMLQYRTGSLGSVPTSGLCPSIYSHAATNGAGNATKSASDPFDADWAALASKAANPNNPFIQPTTTKAFEIHM